MNRLRKYFSQWTREDIEVVFYFLVAFVMVIFIPAFLFFDYTKTLEFSLWWYRVKTIVQITFESWLDWLFTMLR